LIKRKKKTHNSKKNSQKQPPPPPKKKTILGSDYITPNKKTGYVTSQFFFETINLTPSIGFA